MILSKNEKFLKRPKNDILKILLIKPRKRNFFIQLKNKHCFDTIKTCSKNKNSVNSTEKAKLFVRKKKRKKERKKSGNQLHKEKGKKNRKSHSKRKKNKRNPKQNEWIRRKNEKKKEDTKQCKQNKKERKKENEKEFCAKIKKFETRRQK